MCTTWKTIDERTLPLRALSAATCSSSCTHHCCSCCCCCCIYRCSCNCHTLYALHLYLRRTLLHAASLSVASLRLARCCLTHTHTHRHFDSCMPTLYALLACSCCCCCSTHRFKSAKLLAVFQLIQLALPAKQAKALKAVANCKGNVFLNFFSNHIWQHCQHFN